MIIVTDEIWENSTNSLNDIYEVLWENGLITSQVLSRVTAESWSLSTFMPYQNDCFELIELKIASFTLLNYTENMNVSMTQLFPRKLKHFNQCPLHIAVSTVDPLVVAYNTSDGKNQYKGIDIDIITQISKMLNFNIKFMQTTDGTNNGVAFPNGTVTGNLKLVI